MSLSHYEIAKQTGFARSTVSRALSNHPAISSETREKVKEVAKKIGYKKNALISMLSARVRATKTKGNKLTIAYISAAPIEDVKESIVTVHSQIYQGILKRADDLGYNIDYVYRYEKGMTSKKLQNLLRARGIWGVLLAPRPSPIGHLSLNWKKLAAVSVAHPLPSPAIDYVSPAYFQNIGIALRKIIKYGYRRIGFCISERTNRFANLEFSSRYALYAQELPAKSRIPSYTEFGLDMAKDIETFEKWYRRNNPEVIIHAGPTIPFCLQALGIAAPREVATCDVMLSKASAGAAGVTQLDSVIGASSVDLLVERLHNYELGIPEYLKIVSIQGRWIDGSTLPKAV